MTGLRKSRLDGSRAQRRRGRYRRYKLPRLSATMTCRNAFRVIARGCLDDLLANQEAACQGDPEALHQMRIALTRLRAARSFFSPFIPSSEWSHVRDELKWLNKHLSRTRDLDVALKRLPSDEAPGRQPQSLDRIWRKTRDTSHQKLRRALHSSRYRTLVHDASTWIDNGDKSLARPQSSVKRHSSSLGTYSNRRLNRWYKKLLKQSQTIADMDTSQCHQLRIRSKRLRYAIEFFGHLRSSEEISKMDALLKFLRKIQKCLGQLNDAEQSRSIASTLAKSDRDDPTRWQSLFPKRRKTRRRIVKIAALTFRQMEELKPF